MFLRRRSARPGSDLLSHALRRSTSGAEGFHGRVREGIGCSSLAMATRSWRPTKRARAFAPGICVLAGCCEVVYVLGVAGVLREVSLGVPGVRRRRRVVDQADPTISTGKLTVLHRFHTRQSE